MTTSTRPRPGEPRFQVGERIRGRNGHGYAGLKGEVLQVYTRMPGFIGYIVRWDHFSTRANVKMSVREDSLESE